MDDRDKTRTPSSGKDGDGVRIVEGAGHGRRRSMVYKVSALILAGCFIGYLVTINTPPSNAEHAGGQHSDAGGRSADGDSLDTAQTSATDAGSVSGREVTARAAAPRRDPDDLASYRVAGQPAPSAEEVIDRLHKAGIYSGIGAFTPPGTSPPLIGLAVPEGFVLPEGYVRHYQATDDGQRIEPILMYSPDFEFFDASGNPINIPPNRVVPPELAPPGLVLPGSKPRPIEIPPALEPRGPSI